MVIPSFSFFLFVLLVCVIYFLVRKSDQWKVLLTASYAFYCLAAPGMLLFLLGSTLSAFFSGLWMEEADQACARGITAAGDSLSKEGKNAFKSKRDRRKQRILLTGLLINLGMLAFLKYFNFLALNLNSLLDLFSSNTRIPALNLLLPLGISFYTFQSCGYIIDVHRGKLAADRHLAKFALFLSFFPQIVQGPISRYSQLAHQLYESHPADYTRIKFGAQLMLWGLFKKMVIADRAAIAVNSIFANYKQEGGFVIFFGVALYSLQVYCDFSGGIDIARGIAQVLGIELPQNFQRPFFATSIENFWRRWHITLGAWMRDYIFYPLSLSKTFAKLGRSARKLFGNDIGKLMPTFLAMFITFLTVGIWHGADWKFVAYGAWNGLLISTGILLGPSLNRALEKLRVDTDSKGWHFLKICGTFLLLTIGRYFSRAESFPIALNMLKWTLRIFNPHVLQDGTLLNYGLTRQDYWVLLAAILVLLVAGILQEKGKSVRATIARQRLAWRWSLYLSAIFAILIFGIYGIQYNALDFIYMGF